MDIENPEYLNKAKNLSLKTNYQKFREHFKTSGLFFALWQSIKYLTFLKNNMIAKGKIKIYCSDYGIQIFWNETEVTKGMGLNVAINTLGIWTDSTKAKWRILERGRDYSKVKVVFRDLALSQIWNIKIKDEQKIYWQIDMKVEEWLRIDEFRIVSLMNPLYKTWINNDQQGDFPSFDNHWRDLYSGSQPVSLVGVRFLKDEFLPSFILESQEENLPAFVHNSPLDINARIIGFRHINPEEKKYYFLGDYHLFSGKINLFTDIDNVI